MSNPDTAMEKRMNMVTLTWPIFIEVFLRMLFMSVDVVMLSSYSDKAVAAVGLMNNIAFFLTILFMMISSGAGIVISQYNGAQKQDKTADVVVASLGLTFVFSFCISLMMYLISAPVVTLFKLEPEVAGYAYDYMVVFGTFSFGLAFNSVFAAILRSYGYSREPMLINMGANVLNVIGNYAFIFGPFGIPILGVTGVAISTVVSYTVSAGVMLLMLRARNIPLELYRIRSVPLTSYKEILQIGVPNAAEMLSYNLAQMAILYVISIMGTASLAAYTYALTVTRFILMFAFAIGQASQVIVGYLVGGKRFTQAYHTVLQNFIVSFVLALCLSSLVALFRYPIIGLFTTDPEITALASSLLICTILLETGRTFNLVIINSLKGAGDVKFPVQVGILSMWGLGVFFSYWLGLVVGLGIIGTWLAISLDEWIRGVVMLFRWRSLVWQRK